MEMNFCRRCGKTLEHIERHIYSCGEHTLFANSAPAVALMLINDDKLLVSVRAIEPFKGSLDIIGGFVDGDETFEEAVARETLEEINLKPEDYSTPKYLTSIVDKYPYQGEVVDGLTVMYVAELLNSTSLQPNEEHENVLFLSRDQIDLEKFPSNSSKHAANTFLNDDLTL